jgi:hypothetical protein
MGYRFIRGIDLTLANEKSLSGIQRDGEIPGRLLAIRLE